MRAVFPKSGEHDRPSSVASHSPGTLQRGQDFSGTRGAQGQTPLPAGPSPFPQPPPPPPCVCASKAGTDRQLPFVRGEDGRRSFSDRPAPPPGVLCAACVGVSHTQHNRGGTTRSLEKRDATRRGGCSAVPRRPAPPSDPCDQPGTPGSEWGRECLAWEPMRGTCPGGRTRGVKGTAPDLTGLSLQPRQEAEARGPGRRGKQRLTRMFAICPPDGGDCSCLSPPEVRPAAPPGGRPGGGRRPRAAGAAPSARGLSGPRRLCP